MDVTPFVGEGMQVVEGYGDGGFTIAGRRWEGSVLVFPERTLAWPVRELAEINADSLAAAAEQHPTILILGCGPRFEVVTREVRVSLRSAGIVVEPMDTGAACRTWNVLLSEGRQAAAALIAV